MVLLCCAGHSGCPTPGVICGEGESRCGCAPHSSAVCAALALPCRGCPDRRTGAAGGRPGPAGAGGRGPWVTELLLGLSAGPTPSEIWGLLPSLPVALEGAELCVRGCDLCPVPSMRCVAPGEAAGGHAAVGAGTAVPKGEDTLFVLFLTCQKQRRLFRILKEFCGITAGCVVLGEAAVRAVCAELCREQAALLQILPCLC